MMLQQVSDSGSCSRQQPSGGLCVHSRSSLWRRLAAMDETAAGACRDMVQRERRERRRRRLERHSTLLEIETAKKVGKNATQNSKKKNEKNDSVEHLVALLSPALGSLQSCAQHVHHLLRARSPARRSKKSPGRPCMSRPNDRVRMPSRSRKLRRRRPRPGATSTAAPLCSQRGG